LAATLGNFSTAFHALSTPLTSVVALAGLALFESFLSLFLVFLDVRLRGHMRTAWAQIVLFPVLWATFWAGVASINPIGRLLMWSPVQGSGSYEWLSRIVGPSGMDWTVAAWAVIFSEAIGVWLMGPADENDREEARIVDLEDNERPPSFHHSESHHVLALAVIMAALTLPSFFLSSMPLPLSATDTTPLTVGCVLPSAIYDKQHTSALENYIAASAQMTGAKVLIWPESAVTFVSPEERDSAFEEVRQKVRGPAVGVSFEEFVPAESGGRVGMKRNGFALLAPNNAAGPTVLLTYYKRHLVPSKSNICMLPRQLLTDFATVAESFSLAPSSDPPTIFHLQLDHPKYVTKPEWASAPNYTRPIPLTASICLDFSSSSAFSALDSRPALILAPARTWHPGVGLAMWEQARARAEEMGSMVLWCDGGEGGVSGVAGGGMTDFMQVGKSSWSRTIAIQWPFNETRTVYARWGNWPLLVLWVLLGGGWAGESIVQRGLGIHAAMGGIRRIMATIRARLRPASPNAQTQSLLD
jgi:hypothetical protein